MASVARLLFGEPTLVGGIALDPDPGPLGEATGYIAQAVGDGLGWTFPAGALEPYAYLSADMLLDGHHLGVFCLSLQEGDKGPRFDLYFGLLNQCQARMAAPLEAVRQNRWQYPRRGAWLKPMAGGERVDLARVDRASLTVLRKSDSPVRWWMGPVTAAAEEPVPLEHPLLPKGPLLDALGQSTLHQWPQKSASPEEVTKRLASQLREAPAVATPAGWSRWGGSLADRVDATGWFRTLNDGRRWWLVDPDGHLFWSAGMDCVRVDTDAACYGLADALTWLPEARGEYAEARRAGHGGASSVNYLAANHIRAFGPGRWREAWAAIALAHLRRLGINTVGNWSEWHVAREAGVPYVRPLSVSWKHSRCVFRDFPDTYDPAFEQDIAAAAEPLRETAEDPALLGYFLMNEPTWGFAQQTPAEGMLFSTPQCAARRALADYLRERYCGDASLSAVWGIDVRISDVAEGEWTKPLTRAARADLALFSGRMASRLFDGMSAACRAVDPHHLNLGARYYTVPPDWAVEAMRSFDVFSMNCYKEQVPPDLVEGVSRKLGRPVLVGEWHFGALDVGLPGSGIGHVRSQEDRARAYRYYVEQAAALPACVGVHYFTLYDESALGRFDGENWNIGLVDVCGLPYGPLFEGARVTHERLYDVAAGRAEPYADAPEYLPMLFL